MRKVLVAVLGLAFGVCGGCEYNRLDAGGDINYNRTDVVGPSDPLPGTPGTKCDSDADCLSGDCANTVGMCR